MWIKKCTMMFGIFGAFVLLVEKEEFNPAHKKPGLLLLKVLFWNK